MLRTFLEWCASRGLNPDTMDADTKAATERMWKMEQDEIKRLLAQHPATPPAPAAGTPKADPTERMNLILGTARAATVTAQPELRAQVLDLATELVGRADVATEAAQRQIQEKIVELSKKPATTPGTSPDQRAEFALPTDPNAVLSKRDIVAVFGQERTDRQTYDLAGRSLVAHIENGNAIPARDLFKELDEKRGLLVVHEETGGRPVRRTITASSQNTMIQVVLGYLLNKAYAERPPETDALVTIVPGGFSEGTLPEVESEDGVRRIKESDPYPMMGGSDRAVKTGYVKYGAAIAQTREDSVFDRLGRVQVHLKSMARQLRRYRDDFRLARICDSTTLDGRYIGRPGNDSGTAAFYSGSADNRGNTNLKTSNALADETDIDGVVQLLESMKLQDGTYVMPELKVLLVPSALKATAWKILHSLYAPSAVAATGQPLQPNPYGPGGMLSALPRVISHPKVATYAGASTTWFAGDPQQQFYEVEHWPLEVVPVLAAGEMSLRDIVNAWKGSFCVDLVALSNMFFVKNTA